MKCKEYNDKEQKEKKKSDVTLKNLGFYQKKKKKKMIMKI